LEVPWRVTSFSATIGSRSSNSNGNKFTQEQLNQMSKLDRGTPIMISEIYAVGEGGVKKRLQSIVLVLQ
jgi:alanine-alpha-ketoisovalerate/valine-pyruvate aminotransferase